eukprot:GILI01006889.1.p1 GENE.GILI01006889.1~~GILI01006889.1.p1  ORF type:complete len:999 (+),score=272.62 GILI01006889.1:314-2998(+)
MRVWAYKAKELLEVHEWKEKDVRRRSSDSSSSASSPLPTSSTSSSRLEPWMEFLHLPQSLALLDSFLELVVSATGPSGSSPSVARSLGKEEHQLLVRVAQLVTALGAERIFLRPLAPAPAPSLAPLDRYHLMVNLVRSRLAVRDSHSLSLFSSTLRRQLLPLVRRACERDPSGPSQLSDWVGALLEAGFRCAKKDGGEWARALEVLLATVLDANSSSAWGFKQAHSLFLSHVALNEADTSTVLADPNALLCLETSLKVLGPILAKSADFRAYVATWRERVMSLHGGDLESASGINQVTGKALQASQTLEILTSCLEKADMTTSAEDRTAASELLQFILHSLLPAAPSYARILSSPLEQVPSLATMEVPRAASFALAHALAVFCGPLSAELSAVDWDALQKLILFWLSQPVALSPLSFTLSLLEQFAPLWKGQAAAGGCECGQFAGLAFAAVARLFTECAENASVSNDVLTDMAGVLVRAASSSWSWRVPVEQAKSLLPLLVHDEATVQRTSFYLLLQSPLFSFGQLPTCADDQEMLEECARAQAEDGGPQESEEEFPSGLSTADYEQRDKLRVQAAVDKLLPAALPSLLAHISSHQQDSLATADLGDLFGRLLSWTLFFNVFARQSAANRDLLTSWLKTHNLLSSLMHTLASLLPDVRHLPASLVASPELVAHLDASGLDPDSPSDVLLLVGHVFYRAIRLLPAAVRAWWSDADRHRASKVDKFTEKVVTPLLVRLEFQTIQGKGSRADASALAIRAMKTSREVVATYMKDEAVLELLIRCPPSYPLKVVEVDCTKKLGVSESKWRRWILSMMTLISTQNGTILDAILLWQRNIDKQFEGVDDCPICISTVHPTDHSLPRMACRTCRNKFHSTCLYKWFSSSNKSECPLCKSPF